MPAPPALGKAQANSNQVISNLAPISSVTSHSQVPPSRWSQPPPDFKEQKYNVVIFGLAECPKGTPRKDRISRDEDAIVKSIQQQIPSFNSSNIRDSFRLGKYSEVCENHPRPILTTLNKASDVPVILSKRFPQGSIRVKPDLPLETRHMHSILRKERQLLINQDQHDHSSIRIRGNKIYIGDCLYGRVEQDKFIKGDSLGDLAPALDDITHCDSNNQIPQDDSFHSNHSLPATSTSEDLTTPQISH